MYCRQKLSEDFANFAAFTEYMNFTSEQDGIFRILHQNLRADLEIVKRVCSFNKHLYFYCRGEKTMMNFYKMAEKSCEECQQLAPAMDFDLFTGYFL